jgi:hypothetical protein
MPKRCAVNSCANNLSATLYQAAAEGMPADCNASLQSRLHNRFSTDEVRVGSAKPVSSRIASSVRRKNDCHDVMRGIAVRSY